MSEGLRTIQKRRSVFVLWLFVMAFATLPLWAASQSPQHPTVDVDLIKKFGFKPPKGEYDGKYVQQPIEFSHNIHVAENKINCLYCHTYARRSKVAGIPPISKCMGCHEYIAADKKRIINLSEYWKKKQSPVWKKINDLPDFVHFSHEIHLQRFVFDAGFPVENVKLICAFCHGDVESMGVARKVKPLNMGWCRRCHMANKGPSDCTKCHK